MSHPGGGRRAWQPAAPECGAEGRPLDIPSRTGEAGRSAAATRRNDERRGASLTRRHHRGEPHAHRPPTTTVDFGHHDLLLSDIVLSGTVTFGRVRQLLTITEPSGDSDVLNTDLTMDEPGI